MSFIRSLSPTYFAPASLNALDADGKLIVNKFDCQFKRHTKEQLEQLDAKVKSWPAKGSDRRLLEEVMTGWRMAADDKAATPAFSMAAVDATESEFPGFIKACIKSFFLSTEPTEAAHLAEKN